MTHLQNRRKISLQRECLATSYDLKTYEFMINDFMAGKLDLTKMFSGLTVEKELN